MHAGNEWLFMSLAGIGNPAAVYDGVSPYLSRPLLNIPGKTHTSPSRNPRIKVPRRV